MGHTNITECRIFFLFIFFLLLVFPPASKPKNLNFDSVSVTTPFVPTPGREVRAAGVAAGRWPPPRHVLLFDMRATCQSMASSLQLLRGLGGIDF